MDPDFWHERWRGGQIGFHQSKPNPHLVSHWPSIGKGGCVFVPLCGKSLDMLWLRDQGHDVLGVELSPLAVRDFFEEAGLAATQAKQRAFDVTEAGRIRLLCGDVFDLTARDLEKVQAVYDRAALVALPPETRKRYAALLQNHLPERVAMLLVTFEYDQEKMQGPPFSVSESELRELFAEFSIELIERSDAVDAPPHLRERGLDAIRDAVYVLRR